MLQQDNDSLISPKLIEDLLNLEKDFKYNLELLSVRDSEIIRIKSANCELQSKLDGSLADVVQLQLQLRRVQKTHDDAVNEARRLLHEEHRRAECSWQMEKKELQMGHERVLREKQDDHRKEMALLNRDNAGQEKRQIMEIKSQLVTSQQHFTQLQLDFQQTRKFHSDSAIAYKQEIQYLNNTIADLNTELKHSKILNTQRIVDLNREIKGLDNQLAVVVGEKSVLVQRETMSLARERQLAKKCQVVLQEFREVEEKRRSEEVVLGEVRRELGEYKRKLESCLTAKKNIGRSSSKGADHCTTWCNDPDHVTLARQNVILQQLVKAMRTARDTTTTATQLKQHREEQRHVVFCRRREVSSFSEEDDLTKRKINSDAVRDDASSKNLLEESEVAEQRIGKLEELVELLKRKLLDSFL